MRGDVLEHRVRARAGSAIEYEQPARAAFRERALRDALLRQVVGELVDAHQGTRRCASTGKPVVSSTADCCAGSRRMWFGVDVWPPPKSFVAQRSSRPIGRMLLAWNPL